MNFQLTRALLHFLSLLLFVPLRTQMLKSSCCCLLPRAPESQKMSTAFCEPVTWDGPCRNLVGQREDLPCAVDGGAQSPAAISSCQGPSQLPLSPLLQTPLSTPATRPSQPHTPPRVPSCSFSHLIALNLSQSGHSFSHQLPLWDSDQQGPGHSLSP
jgi:hypothetical protein